ncbi:MAG: tRNA adenosine(34) deaminase TadA [Clostridia bacterium]|nr:tRNA adenosine(34) deaminase TadA [Clostridia bacterium]
MKNKFMLQALRQAKKAEEKDEVPIGAVIVKDGKVIARAFNARESTQIATAHAEIRAIEKASKKLKSWRLDGAEMFVTLEPCPMCAGAIVLARIKKVYFGAYEQKSGSAESKFRVLEESGMNHKTEYEGGVMEKECQTLLKDYFKRKREENKQ